MNSLGAYVSQRRKTLGLRQQDLADALGYTVQAISKFENAQSQMDISSLPKLAQTLQLSLEDLLKQNVEPTSPACAITFSSEIVAANLLHLRNSIKASQGQTAKWMGVSKRSVANYESGASLPSVNALVGFLSHFKITADDFFGKKLGSEISAKKSKSLQKPLLIGLGIALFAAIVIGSTSPLWIPKRNAQGNSESIDSVGTNQSSNDNSVISSNSSSSFSSSSSSSSSSSASSSSATVSSSSSAVTSYAGDDIDPSFPGLKEFSLRSNDVSALTVAPGDYEISLHCEPTNYIQEQGYSFALNLSQTIEGVSLSTGATEYASRTLKISKNVANNTHITVEGTLIHNGTILKRKCIFALTNPTGEISTNFPGIVAFYATINGASDVSLTPGTYPIEFHSPDAEGNDVSLDSYQISMGLSAPKPTGFEIAPAGTNAYNFVLGDDAGDGVSVSCGPMLLNNRNVTFIFGTMGLNVTAINPGH